MDNIVHKIKYFESHPNDINITRFLDKRLHIEDLLHKLDDITNEIINDINTHPLIQNSSRYIIVDIYYFPIKYLPIQKEICADLTKKLQQSGLSKAFVEIVQGVVTIHPNF